MGVGVGGVGDGRRCWWGYVGVPVPVVVVGDASVGDGRWALGVGVGGVVSVVVWQHPHLPL
jgi:hypothetical protein